MIISDMHNYTKLELDKTSSLELPAFEPEEIDYWLNESISKFSETRYNGTNTKQQSFEEVQKRIDDLRSLVETVHPTIAVSSDYTNAWECDLPSDYLHAISYSSTISWPAGEITQTSAVFPVKQISQDRLNKYLLDPFGSHVFHLNRAEPLLFYKASDVTDGDIIVITDGNYDITDLELTYLRQPAVVSLSSVISCDLPEHTHREIVKMAANMMLENIESNRYQTHSREVASME